MADFESILRHSKILGADECEVTSVAKRIITVRITDSEIAELKQGFEESFGIRMIAGKRIASCQTDGKDNIERIMANSLRQPAAARGFWRSLPHECCGTGNLEGTFDGRLDCMECSDAADVAQTMINSSLDGKISAVSGSLNVVSERFTVENSHGLSCSDRATYISGTINSESESGDVAVSGLGHECCRTLDKFPAEKVGLDSRRSCIESANPDRCEGGRYTLILEPYSVGELLAFVMFPNFGLRSVAEKKSCFADSLGKQVAADGCTLVDDPHIPQGMGTKLFDDEGVQTRKNTLVRDGVFQNVFSNLYDGFKEGRESTGNAARQGLPLGRSAEPIPASLPHNLHLMPGDSTVDEMVRETRHGLLVGRLWYTYALNPIKGDFSCTARSGIRIIENGEIVRPGLPVRIVHNLHALLQNISGIGKDAKNILQWASIPSIAPAVKIEDVVAAPI